MQETLLDSWFEKTLWRRDRLSTPVFLGFPGGSAGKDSACNAGDLGSDPRVGKIPWRRKKLPTPVFWPGEFHGLYSPWGSQSWTQLSDFHSLTQEGDKFTITPKYWWHCLLLQCSVRFSWARRSCFGKKKKKIQAENKLKLPVKQGTSTKLLLATLLPKKRSKAPANQLCNSQMGVINNVRHLAASLFWLICLAN